MKAAAIFLCLMLCVGAPARAAAAPKLDKYKGADAGHLLVSAGISGNGGLRLYLKRLDAPGEATLGVFTTTLKNVHYFDNTATERPPQLPPGLWVDGELPARGYVRDFALPPGKYELSYLEASILEGIVRHSFIFPRDPRDSGVSFFERDKRSTGVAFEIRTGQVTYLGRFHTFRLMRKNGLGLDVPIGTYLTYADEKEKDLSLASERYPQLSGVMATAASAGPVSFGP